jgi:hypothetical protein
MKGVNVRVNAIAPGVYESEMTYDSIGPDLVDKVGKGLIPLPSKRAGTWVLLPNLYTDIETIYYLQWTGNGRNSGLPCITSWRLYERPGAYHRWWLLCSQPCLRLSITFVKLIRVAAT